MASLFVKATTLLAACSSILTTVAAAPGKSSLPIVDLGYERHQAYSFNSSGQYYNFTNIRYAAPPTGELRFRAPQSPAQNRGTVQTGSVGSICAQADPNWVANIAPQFIPEYLAGQTVFNHSSFNTTTGAAPSLDPRTSEDCLFLDVLVPKQIFDKAGKCKGSAVMVWIYGGGYTAGSKDGSGNPAGLIARSMDQRSEEGVIYVSMNYRLGAFGWLSGPAFQKDGTANAGLYDQRFALEWVQAHIAQFGGDPDRVTVFGESAGGGSLMHQITAYGGEKPVPFQQAIPQSPGFQPFDDKKQQNNIFHKFLDILNVSTIAEARKLPFSDLLIANAKQVAAARYGGFVYGPAVDGDFVPELPGLLLEQGKYAKDLNLMLGHNTDEGLLFTSPFLQSDAIFNRDIKIGLPELRQNQKAFEAITQKYYPAVFDGSQNYTNNIARYALYNSEEIFTCNTVYLAKAFGLKTHNYLFSVYPGTHGEDVPYTYYNGPNPAVVAPPIALALQEYLTNFAMTGNPNGPGVPHFPIYGESATMQDLNATGITQIMDPAANARCDWWQSAHYLVADEVIRGS